MKVFASMMSAAALLVLAVGSDESPEQRAAREQRAAAAEAAHAEDVASREAADKAKWDALPETERRFCEALKQYAQKYGAAETDLKKSKLVSERGKALRAAVPGGKVSRWKAEIGNITTTGQGNVVIEMRLPCEDFGLGTWNNELSDMLDNTLISRTSSAYDTLAELKSGDELTFDGRLIGDERLGFKDTSMTEIGTMTGGFFLIRF